MAEYQPAICGIYPYGCAVLVAKNGKIVKADNDTSHGYLCPRGNAALQIVHSKNDCPYHLSAIVSKGRFSFKRRVGMKLSTLLRKDLEKVKRRNAMMTLNRRT
jgi:hypothetical protein